MIVYCSFGFPEIYLIHFTCRCDKQGKSRRSFKCIYSQFILNSSTKTGCTVVSVVVKCLLFADDICVYGSRIVVLNTFLNIFCRYNAAEQETFLIAARQLVQFLKIQPAALPCKIYL